MKRRVHRLRRRGRGFQRRRSGRTLPVNADEAQGSPLTHGRQRHVGRERRECGAKAEMSTLRERRRGRGRRLEAGAVDSGASDTRALLGAHRIDDLYTSGKRRRCEEMDERCTMPWTMEADEGRGRRQCSARGKEEECNTTRVERCVSVEKKRKRERRREREVVDDGDRRQRARERDGGSRWAPQRSSSRTTASVRRKAM